VVARIQIRGCPLKIAHIESVGVWPKVPSFGAVEKQGRPNQVRKSLLVSSRNVNIKDLVNLL
jgi:hypothetical protein